MGGLKTALPGLLAGIIPAEETYFISVEKPNAKISREIIQLNYASLSPFKKSEIIFYQGKNRLFLWFVREGRRRKKIAIPEGFLLYKSAKVEGDAVIMKQKKDKWIFIVVKNRLMETQIVKDAQTDPHRFIDLLKSEYSLVHPAILTAKDAEAFPIGMGDMWKFSSALDLAPRLLAKNLIEALKIPMIVFLLLLNGGELTLYLHFNHILSGERARLETLKKQNITVKKQYKYLEAQKAFWERFRRSELEYPGPYDILNVLAGQLLKRHGSVNTYQQRERIIDAWVQSDSSSALVEDLMKTGRFQDIKILDITQGRKDKSRELAQLEMRLKTHGR